MKYLWCLLLVFASCSSEALPPKYVYTQKVRYTPDPFWRLVCSGEGTVELFSDHYSTKIPRAYQILPPYDERLNGCPAHFWYGENEIQELKGSK